MARATKVAFLRYWITPYSHRLWSTDRICLPLGLSVVSYVGLSACILTNDQVPKILDDVDFPLREAHHSVVVRGGLLR
jgi:hypothetical protein